MKVKEFSEQTGIPYRTLQQYLSDDRAPAADALTKICAQTNINIHWLLTGEDPMYRNETAEPTAEHGLKPRQIGLLKLFDTLSERQQQEILSITEEKERLNKLDSLVAEYMKTINEED